MLNNRSLLITPFKSYLIELWDVSTSRTDTDVRDIKPFKLPLITVMRSTDRTCCCERSGWRAWGARGQLAVVVTTLSIAGWGIGVLRSGGLDWGGGKNWRNFSLVLLNAFILILSFAFKWCAGLSFTFLTYFNGSLKVPYWEYCFHDNLGCIYVNNVQSCRSKAQGWPIMVKLFASPRFLFFGFFFSFVF